MKRVNYYLTDKQHDGLKKLAGETELSVSELIRRAVDLYLATEEDKRKRGKHFRESHERGETKAYGDEE